MSTHIHTLDNLLSTYKVKGVKFTSAGRIAIRKGGQWLYFKWDAKTNAYEQTGSSLKLQHT